MKRIVQYLIVITILTALGAMLLFGIGAAIYYLWFHILILLAFCLACFVLAWAFKFTERIIVWAFNGVFNDEE